MVLNVKNIVTGIETKYILTSPEDFEELFHIYPKTKEICLYADNITDAANKVTAYLNNSSRLDCWLEGDNIMKSIKGLAVVAGLIMPAATGGHLLEQKPDFSMVQPSHHETEFGKAPEDQFLWTLMQLESSGGKNTEHHMVEQGPLKGETALGRWGLMKPTIKEVLDRMKIDGKLTPDMRPMYTMDRTQLLQHFKDNPAVELNMARILARHVLKRQKGDLKRAAYSWNHGHNLKPENISDDTINQSKYVKKFTTVNSMNPYKKDKLNKAQAESLNDFKMRLQDWTKVREVQNTKLFPQTSSYAPDPGPLRDPKLDEKPKKGIMGVLEWAKKMARKDNQRQ